jgi:type IV pilus assembly protein PilE
MKKIINGFTLIELLVVVLIIGILAAVALPQYTKAAERGKASEALIMGKAIRDSLDRYALANGAWPDTFNPDDLDISVPPNASFTGGVMKLNRFSYSYSGLGTGKNVLYVPSTKPLSDGSVIWFDIYAVSNSGKIHCNAVSGTRAEQICKTYGKFDAVSGTHMRYRL